MLPLGILNASTKKARPTKKSASATGMERAESQRKPQGSRARRLSRRSTAARSASVITGRPKSAARSLMPGDGEPADGAGRRRGGAAGGRARGDGRSDGTAGRRNGRGGADVRHRVVDTHVHHREYNRARSRGRKAPRTPPGPFRRGGPTPYDGSPRGGFSLRTQPSLVHRHSVRSAEVVVDLCALEGAGEVDVADLGLGVELVDLPAALAVPVAGLLHAAEGQVRLGADGRRVDVRDAVVELGERPEGDVHVARVDRGREPVAHAVVH